MVKLTDFNFSSLKLQFDFRKAVEFLGIEFEAQNVFTVGGHVDFRSIEGLTQMIVL